ncbi:MAG: AIR synthase related protein, partial [Pseudomonadota bacterium]|nr:AIR synthase related protein [Pseudomonadota bacterium]
CDIPLGPLADDAPLYERPYLNRDEYRAWAKVAPLGDIPESTDIAADLLKLMASPAIASRRWIWEQYDSQVGADTVQTGGDAAVVRVHGTRKALAMTTDCTPRYCYADPVEGGKQAVAEAYRNLCAVGARPLAITNCLNFGNPQRSEIMAQIVGCLEGMSEACLALDMPIVSGNVSLYNESKATGGGSAILPTPAIGAVGVLEDWEKSATIGLKSEDQTIWLVGASPADRIPTSLGQSLWLNEVLARKEGEPPRVDLGAERRTGELIRQLILVGDLTAIHDVSDGGILVTVAEMALTGNIGATLIEDQPTAFWFGETQTRYVVTARRDQVLPIIAMESGVLAVPIGRTGGDAIAVGASLASLADLRAAHEGFFPTLMGADAALA